MTDSKHATFHPRVSVLPEWNATPSFLPNYESSLPVLEPILRTFSSVMTINTSVPSNGRTPTRRTS